jgi:hypothetical protein
MAAASGYAVKSDRAQVKQRELWRSGAALMSGSGWSAEREEEAAE